MGILENYVKTLNLQIKVIWDIVKIIQTCLPIPDKMRKQHGCLGRGEGPGEGSGRALLLPGPVGSLLFGDQRIRLGGSLGLG